MPSLSFSPSLFSFSHDRFLLLFIVRSLVDAYSNTRCTDSKWNVKQRRTNKWKKIVHKTRQWDAEWAERKVHILAFERYRKQRICSFVYIEWLIVKICIVIHFDSRFLCSFLMLIRVHFIRRARQWWRSCFGCWWLFSPFISQQKYCVKNCKRHNIIIVQIIRRVMHRRQRRERWRDAIVSQFFFFLHFHCSCWCWCSCSGCYYSFWCFSCCSSEILYAVTLSIALAVDVAAHFTKKGVTAREKKINSNCFTLTRQPKMRQ